MTVDDERKEGRIGRRAFIRGVVATIAAPFVLPSLAAIAKVEPDSDIPLELEWGFGPSLLLDKDGGKTVGAATGHFQAFDARIGKNDEAMFLRDSFLRNNTLNGDERVLEFESTDPSRINTVITKNGVVVFKNWVPWAIVDDKANPTVKFNKPLVKSYFERYGQPDHTISAKGDSKSVHVYFKRGPLGFSLADDGEGRVDTIQVFLPTNQKDYEEKYLAYVKPPQASLTSSSPPEAKELTQEPTEKVGDTTVETPGIQVTTSFEEEKEGTP